jgi:hypothetical protein
MPVRRMYRVRRRVPRVTHHYFTRDRDGGTHDRGVAVRCPGTPR